MNYSTTLDEYDKFSVTLSSNVDYKAGDTLYYYVSARDTDTAPGLWKLIDDADTPADRWISTGTAPASTQTDTDGGYHWFKINTTGSGSGFYDYSMDKRPASTDSNPTNFKNDGWVAWKAGAEGIDSVANLSNNKIYNNEDVRIKIAISPSDNPPDTAHCTFYYRVDGVTPTIGDYSFSPAISNCTETYNTTTEIAEYELIIPADINSAGCTIQILADGKDGDGYAVTTSTLFKYIVLATPGTPSGDDDTAVVSGRGNKDGKYPTTDFYNYSPLRHAQNEIIKTGDTTRYLMPRTTDQFIIDANFLTTTGNDGITDVFYSDQIKFYLRSAYRDIDDIDGNLTPNVNEAYIVWQATTTTFWTEARLKYDSSGNDNQTPHYLKYHWLLGENIGLEGYSPSNPSDCTKGAAEGATVKYIFKVRDNQSTSSSDFRWIYRDPTTKKQRLTDSESTAQTSGNQFEYKVLQDDYTRPVAYMPREIPGVTPQIADGGVIPSTYTAPSWPSARLGSTSTSCGSTTETVKIYVGLFDTADGRFTNTVFGSTASFTNINCTAENPNYIHKTFGDPNRTNSDYYKNNVDAVNTSTNTESSGIKGGKVADTYEEMLEGYNSQGRRVAHDILCYYVWRKCGSHTGGTVNSFSWIDWDGTINNNPSTDPTGTDVIAESGSDLVNQLIRIANVDGVATDDSKYVTKESSAATEGYVSGRVSMTPYNVDSVTGNGVWSAEIPSPDDMDLMIATAAVSFLYYRIWACNGDNDPQAYNMETHGGSLLSAGVPSDTQNCQPHNSAVSKWGTASDSPYGKTFIQTTTGETCKCGRVHDRDYGWVDITRYGGKVTSPKRVKIKSQVKVGGVSRIITTYLKIDPTTNKPTNVISTHAGAE